jgi:hypothetical protein
MIRSTTAPAITWINWNGTNRGANRMNEIEREHETKLRAEILAQRTLLLALLSELTDAGPAGVDAARMKKSSENSLA